MPHRLSQLEARVEQLVEGAFKRLFASRLDAREVGLALARAMEDGATVTPEGRQAAPERYDVHLNPQDALALLDAEPELPERLGDELIALAREGGFTLPRRPDVTIVPDATLALHAIAVETRARLRGGETLASTPARGLAAQFDSAPAAFLIVDGDRHVTLDEPVISIGRRVENQIVLDDPRISRTHAQIRPRFGRWMIFDLGSSSGTRVNGEPVAEWALKPGDVIDLGGAQLIYGEEATQPKFETGGTRPLSG